MDADVTLARMMVQRCVWVEGDTLVFDDELYARLRGIRLEEAHAEIEAMMKRFLPHVAHVAFNEELL